MTRQTQATHRTTIRCISIASAILLIALTTAAPAQQTLGDLVREGGFEWLLGNWTAALDQATKVHLTYRWTIKDQLMTVDFKAGDYAYHGMIFISPDSGEVVEIGVDSKGAYAKSIWGPDGMDAVSTSIRRDAQGNTERLAFVHSEVDSKTMRVALHEVDTNGARAERAQVVMEYKRGPAKSVKKAEVTTREKPVEKTPEEPANKTRKKKAQPRTLSVGVNGAK